MSEVIKLKITETYKKSIKEDYCSGEVITETFKTQQNFVEYLIDRYGRMPNGRNKVYLDIENKSVQIGFIHSFWNKEDGWFQQDWITFWKEDNTKTYFELKL